MKLKKHFLRRDKYREKSSSGLFTRVEASGTFIIKTILPMMFPTVVSITSIYSHNAILSILNSALVLFYFVNEIYKLITGQQSVSNFLAMLLGLVTVIAATLSISYAFIPLVYSLTNLLLVANIFMPIITAYFALKDVVFPPFFSLINFVFNKLGFDLSFTYIHEKELSYPKDRFIIDKLLAANFDQKSSFVLIKEGASGRDKLNERVAKINNILKFLLVYKNKYTNKLLGSLRYKKEIAAIDSRINKLVVEGDASDALAFIKKKTRFKQTKIDILTEIKDELESYPNDISADKGKPVSVMSTITFYFNMESSKKTEAQYLQDGIDTCINNIEQYHARIARYPSLLSDS